MDASDIAAAWRLEPHPEGGFYRETFRSETAIELPGWLRYIQAGAPFA